MRIIYTIFMLIMGTIFGSFYNVVGYRIPNGLSIVKPGSFCPKCNHSLKCFHTCSNKENAEIVKKEFLLFIRW